MFYHIDKRKDIKSGILHEGASCDGDVCYRSYCTWFSMLSNGPSIPSNAVKCIDLTINIEKCNKKNTECVEVTKFNVKE